MRNKAIFEKIDCITYPAELRNAGVYSYYREIISCQDTEVYLKGGRKVLMLGSNSYLGLTSHPEVKEAAIEAVRKYGTGCAGSRLLNGTFDIHHQLEGELADWTGKEGSLLFSTGFQVNQGVMSSLVARNDHIIMDKFSHASLIDGGKLAGAILNRFPHNDTKRLDKILGNISPDKGKLVITEGIFSMHGDIVDLPSTAALCEKHNAVLMVDDAHALGVIGREGAGSAAHFGLTDKVDLIMGTFSKSLASLGGFIASDAMTIDWIKHYARAQVFSASMAPPSVGATLAALRIIRREPERIERLWKVTAMMREGLQSIGYNTGLSNTPIIPVYIGEMGVMWQMSKRLEEEGVFVNSIIPPAVPPSDTLIRLSLTSEHTEKQVEFALGVLERLGKELGIIS